MEFAVAVDEEEAVLAVCGGIDGVACFHEGGEVEDVGFEGIDGEIVGCHIGEGEVLAFLPWCLGKGVEGQAGFEAPTDVEDFMAIGEAPEVGNGFCADAN